MQCPTTIHDIVGFSDNTPLLGRQCRSASASTATTREKSRMEKHNKSHFRIANMTIDEQTRLDHDHHIIRP